MGLPMLLRSLSCFIGLAQRPDLMIVVGAILVLALFIAAVAG